MNKGIKKGDVIRRGKTEYVVELVLGHKVFARGPDDSDNIFWARELTHISGKVFSAGYDSSHDWSKQ